MRSPIPRSTISRSPPGQELDRERPGEAFRQHAGPDPVLLGGVEGVARLGQLDRPDADLGLLRLRRRGQEQRHGCDGACPDHVVPPL
jgi:hypothetical protein